MVRSRSISFSAACAVVVLSAIFFGPIAKADSRAAECRWTARPLTMNLDSDRAIWKQAAALEDFRIPAKSGPESKPRTATTAQLLWDREYLYFHAEMEDHDLVVRSKEHQGTLWTSDVFELFFKPFGGKDPYYEFEVNPSGATLELAFPARNIGGYGRFRDLTHIDMKVVTRADGTINQPGDRDHGWEVEGRIPWRDLTLTGGRPEPDDRWAFNVCRMDYTTGVAKQELSSWSRLSVADFHHYEDYATLRFVGPGSADAARPYGIDHRTLWTTSHVVGFPDPPPPYTLVRAFPNLHVERPLYILEEPGRNDFLLLQHLQYWAGPSRLLRFANDPKVDHAETLLDIDRLVYGMTLDPDFLQNGWIYLIGNGPCEAKDHFNRISRYTIDRKTGRIDPKSELPIIEWESNGHDGGDLAFGPDGYLYHAAGDGSADSDANLRGQDLTHLNGAMIRIDVHHPSAGRAYSIPPDNPFLHTPGARPEIWAFGFRNPWRLTFDRHTGQLWVGQNGQDAWEQVYIVHRGENYGWSVYEGSHPFNLLRKRAAVPITFPLIDHPHSEMRSLTGGVVYYGSKLPELNGAFIYGDWSTGRIWGVKAPNDRITWHRELVRSTLQIVGFRETSDGNLLVVDEGGGIYRIEPAPKTVGTPPFPRKLSETGLFASTVDDRPMPGLIPYEVNAPLWSDGALKERFIAVPGDGTIEMTPQHGWNFPEGTVLVKTFSLENRLGDPKSARRVETRLLTKELGQWVGYTYRWNDKQTDADLVEAAGEDRDYPVPDSTRAGGVRNRIWHFPSRTECMTCHTRASNFVLGPSVLQLNRDHDYGPVRDNQLRTLEHLGILRVDYMGFVRDELKRGLMNEGRTEQEADAITAERTGTTDAKDVRFSSLLPFDPDHLPRLVDPSDASQSVSARARSYLHANCAICHVKEGGGNALIDLDYLTPPDRMRVIGAPPQHEQFQLAHAQIVAPGHPEWSVLYHRMAVRGQGQMPPLATRETDVAAVKLIRDWIEGLQ